MRKFCQRDGRAPRQIRILEAKKNAAAAIARKFYNDYSFVFKSYDEEDEASRHDKLTEGGSMLITVDALNDAFVRLGMDDIRTELEDQAERVLTATEIYRNDPTSENSKMLQDQKFKYLRYRKHAHAKISHTRWISHIDEALKRVITDTDGILFDITEMTEKESYRSDEDKAKDALKAIMDLDELGIKPLDKRFKKAVTAKSDKEKLALIEGIANDFEASIRQNLSLLTNTSKNVPQFDGSSNNNEDEEDEEQKRLRQVEEAENRSDDFFIVADDVNYMDHLRPLYIEHDYARFHPRIQVSEYHMNDRTLVLFICKCKNIYGSRRRAEHHAENCGKDEEMEVSEAETVEAGNPNTPNTPKRVASKAVEEEIPTKLSRPSPRTSSVRTSSQGDGTEEATGVVEAAEANADECILDTQNVEVIDLEASDFTSEEELEVVFANVGQDSGTDGHGVGQTDAEPLEPLELPKADTDSVEVLAIKNDYFRAMLPPDDARHRLEVIREAEIGDKLALAVGELDLRNDLNRRYRRLLDLGPTDLRNGLASRHTALERARLRTNNIVTNFTIYDEYSSDDEFSNILLRDAARIRETLETEIETRLKERDEGLALDYGPNQMEELREWISLLSKICIMINHRKRGGRGDQYDIAMLDAFKTKMDDYINTLKKSRETLQRINDRIKQRRLAKEQNAETEADNEKSRKTTDLDQVRRKRLEFFNKSNNDSETNSRNRLWAGLGFTFSRYGHLGSPDNSPERPERPRANRDSRSRSTSSSSRPTRPSTPTPTPTIRDVQDLRNTLDERARSKAKAKGKGKGKGKHSIRDDPPTYAEIEGTSQRLQDNRFQPLNLETETEPDDSEEERFNEAARLSRIEAAASKEREARSRRVINDPFAASSSGTSTAMVRPIPQRPQRPQRPQPEPEPQTGGHDGNSSLPDLVLNETGRVEEDEEEDPILEVVRKWKKLENEPLPKRSDSWKSVTIEGLFRDAHKKDKMRKQLRMCNDFFHTLKGMQAIEEKEGGLVSFLQNLQDNSERLQREVQRERGQREVSLDRRQRDDRHRDEAGSQHDDRHRDEAGGYHGSHRDESEERCRREGCEQQQRQRRQQQRLPHQPQPRDDHHQHSWATSGPDAPYLTNIVDEDGKIKNKIINMEARDSNSQQFIGENLWRSERGPNLNLIQNRFGRGGYRGGWRQRHLEDAISRDSQHRNRRNVPVFHRHHAPEYGFRRHWSRDYRTQDDAFPRRSGPPRLRSEVHVVTRREREEDGSSDKENRP